MRLKLCFLCRSWEALADLPAPEGLASVNEVAAAMDRPPGVRNVNAHLIVSRAVQADSWPPQPVC